MRRPRYDLQLLALALAGGLPALVAATWLTLTSDLPPRYQWPLLTLLTVVWLVSGFALRERVTRPLQTLSNLLAGIREGDYTLRIHAHDRDDPLGLLAGELNDLAETLQRQRLGALETMALLRTVLGELDALVFAVDPEGHLQMVNRAFERALGKPADALLGRPVEELGLAPCLEGAASRTLELNLDGRKARYELRRGGFRQEGEPHRIVLLSDLRRALREEEREAWRRIVRVLGHEINNSLAPIRSISSSLRSAAERDPRAPEWERDLREGLSIVQSRAESLSRFLAAYSKLARLPAPTLRPFPISRLMRRVVGLETRLPVRVVPGPELEIEADEDQLEQLLINLLQNGVEAALETGGGVEATWEVADGDLVVRVRDQGPGVPDTANLFVPFFTTKPGGTGIGLVLSRQIAEAHEGTLTLSDREGEAGSEACLRIPLPEGALGGQDGP